MTKPLGSAAGILLLAFVALCLWRTAGLREPVYEGKPLTRWLQGHVASCAADPRFNSPEWNKKAVAAVRRIGTNAIPTLLRMIRSCVSSPTGRLSFARGTIIALSSLRYAK